MKTKFLLGCLLFVLCIQAYGQAPLPVDHDTIALWNFDSDSLTDVKDSGPNGLHGKAFESLLVNYPEIPSFNFSRKMKDQKSYVDLGILKPQGPLDLTKLNEWSLEFMLRNDQTIHENRNIFDTGLVTVTIHDGQVAAHMSRQGVRVGVETDDELTPGINYRVAVVYKNGELGIFINDRLMAKGSSTIEKKKKSKSVYGQSIRVGGMPSEGISIVEMGNHHACLVTDEGRLKCWGQNNLGQLGVGDLYNDFYIPTLVDRLTSPTKVTIGDSFTCALKSEKVYCWGNNDQLQLGTSFNVLSTIPVEVPGLTNSVDVESGDNHVCSILSDRTIKCWGKNADGQLGLGIMTASSLPVVVPGLNNVKQMALGSNHSCALNDSGNVFCWGSNNQGQLGLPGSSPVLSPTSLSLSGVLSIAAGSMHTCAFFEDHSVKCWGRNDQGQLGDGTTSNSSLPVLVKGMINDTVLKLESNKGHHSCVQLTSGKMKCWGSNDKNQIGLPSSTPFVNIATLYPHAEEVTDLSVGGKTNCLKKENLAFCFGDNEYFQLATDNSEDELSTPEAQILLSVTQAQFPGWIDDIRVSRIARFSLERPTFSVLSPASNVNSEFPVFSIVSQSIDALDPSDMEIELNGEEVSGLTISGNTITGTLSDAFKVGENIFEMYVQDVKGRWGTISMTFLYSPEASQEKPKSIASKGNNSCYLSSVGHVWCWGSNSFGQLGNDSGRYSSSPLRNPDLKNIVSIALGSSTLCALDRDGAVWCLGNNIGGRLGIGNDEIPQSSSPRKVSLSKSVKKLVAGPGNFCALHPDSTMSCWGENSFNTISLDDDSIDAPELFSMDQIKDVQLGHFNSCIIRMNDTLWCWGHNYSGQVGNGTLRNNVPSPVQVLQSVKQVSVGQRSICAVDFSNKGHCWGYDNYYQHGRGVSDVGEVPLPVDVTVMSSLDSIHVGDGVTCGLLNGVAKCWGQNAHGELGNGTFNPDPYGFIQTNLKFKDLKINKSTICGLTETNELYCWGNNVIGQVGVASSPYVTTPHLVEANTTAVPLLSKLISGYANTCLYKGLDLYCSGNNEQGQLGNNSGSFDEVSPIFLGLSGLSQTGIGFGSLCHVTFMGEVMCAGYNVWGQMGVDPQVSTRISVATLIPNFTSVAQVDSGFDFSCARKIEGTVWCWGANDKGQLGNGLNTNTHIPQQVMNLTDVVDIDVAQAGYHVCARKRDQSVWCWGWNSAGQLGSGGANSNLPLQVQGLKGSASISLGFEFTCSLTEEGKAICFGSNTYGQLGLGHNFSNNEFRSVEMNEISQIRAGSRHVCALNKSGFGYCWGDNEEGQLGNDSEKPSNLPISILENITELTSGADFSCALNTENKLLCWGDNGGGQFGNGTNISSSIPVYSDVTK